MCIRPKIVHIPKDYGHEDITVACRQCWACKKQRVNDFVGRSLCEAATSKKTLSLTLTYANSDDLASKVIRPRHFQDFVRSLRKRGHQTRYLACGEYGTKKGRAHFHALLFLTGDTLPNIATNKNTHHPAWPHGHIFCEEGGNERSIRYVCKYLLKEITDPARQEWYSMSKKPTLGHSFFYEKARHHVETGVLPRSFQYMPPAGSQNQNYVLTGATRRDFLTNLIRWWEELRPLETEKLTEWVRDAVQKNQQLNSDLKYYAEQAARPDKLAASREAIVEAESRRPTDKRLKRLLTLAEIDLGNSSHYPSSQG